MKRSGEEENLSAASGTVARPRVPRSVICLSLLPSPSPRFPCSSRPSLGFSSCVGYLCGAVLALVFRRCFCVCVFVRLVSFYLCFVESQRERHSYWIMLNSVAAHGCWSGCEGLAHFFVPCGSCCCCYRFCCWRRRPYLYPRYGIIRGVLEGKQLVLVKDRVRLDSVGMHLGAQS